MTNYGSKHKREQLKQNEESHCLDISEMTSHDVAMEFHFRASPSTNARISRTLLIHRFLQTIQSQSLITSPSPTKSVTFTSAVKTLTIAPTCEDWDEERSPYLAENKETQL